MNKTTIGLLNIEYFDEQASSFGGYGMCARNIVEHFNPNGGPLRFEMLITQRKHRLNT